MHSSLSDEATDEVAALAAILGADCWVDDRVPGRVILAVAPEAMDESEALGALAMEVQLPPGYPATTSATINCTSLSQHAQCFEHREAPAGGFFVPSISQAAALGQVLSSITNDRLGEAVVYDAVDAVRQWLETHTLVQRSPEEATVSALMAESVVSEDDLELDDSDMDEELLDAIKEAIIPADKAALKQLREAERLPSGSVQQRDAIKAVWLSLSKDQKRRVVEDSDEDFVDDDDNADSEEEEEEGDEDIPRGRADGNQAGSGGGGSGGGGASKKQKQAPMPAPAQRTCARGHSLTAVNGQPRDYRKLGAGVGNCDLCGVDFPYTHGGYHCNQCRNWDCCVACGSQTAGGGSAGQTKGAGKSKGKRK